MELACLLRLCLLLGALPEVSPWLVQQPKENVWMTLAKALKQDSLHLRMGSTSDSVSTCLVGIPWGLKKFKNIKREGPNPMPTWHLIRSWDGWMQSLPHAHTEPQELDLLGSARAKFCVRFSPFYHWQDSQCGQKALSKEVSPINQKYYSAAWCNGTDITQTISISKLTDLPPLWG